MFAPLSGCGENAPALVTIPFAGGSASAYRPLLPALTSRHHVVGLQLPGRGHLLRKPAFRSMAVLVEQAAAAIGRQLTGPYVLYGHSMGGRIAYDMACALAQGSGPLPAAVIVSGCGVPDEALPVPHPAVSSHRLSAWFAALGFPSFSAELFRILEPAVRADLEMIATRAPTAPAGLPVPLHVLSGTADPVVDFERQHRWRHFTSKSCVFHSFTGNHFFPYDHRIEFEALIERVLATETAALQPVR
jgi:surfactin synthase thioesterase subunit